MTYDANGNMVEKTLGDQPGLEGALTQFLKYDAENRLVEVATPQETTVEVTFQPGWNFFSLPVIPEDGAVAVLLPTFAQDFEQIAKFEPASHRFTHYVGNPQFDQLAELEYGVGYQVYCKAAAPVTVAFAGRLPSSALSKPLAAGWHLLPAIKLTATPTSQVFDGLSPAAIKRVTPATGALTDTTQVEPGQAYWVQLAAPATWTLPLPQDVTTRYTYDGDGGRTKKITASGSTIFLGQALEKDTATGTTTKYVFAGDQRLAAKDSTGALRFYHGDHLGSSNVITNSTGQLVELAEHTPYGALARREGSVNVPQKFTGQRLDPETGLHFYQARYYDAALGRFISADTIVQAPSDPQTLNRYSYVRNNPLRYVDPSGHLWFLPAIFAAIKVIVSTVVSFAIAHPVAFSAIVGGVSNVAGNASQIHSFGSFVSYAAVGAASSAIGAWTGMQTFGPLSGAFGKLFGGMASAGLGGLTGGFVGGAGNALNAGASLAQAAAMGVQSAVIAGLTSAALFGTTYGIAKTVGALKTARATQQAGGTHTSSARGQPARGRVIVHDVQNPDGTAPGSSTEIVQRAMSRDELVATEDTGLIRGGKVGTPEDPHFVSDAINSDALRARQRLSLPQTPEVRATLEVPSGSFSPSTRVEPNYRMYGGGGERSATGQVPVKVLRVDEMK
jgi:RHS repeat-associated protein